MSEETTDLVVGEGRDKLITESNDLEAYINKVEIKDESTYKKVTGLTRDIKALMKRVIEHHVKAKKATDQAHKDVVAMERELLDPLKALEKTAKRKTTGWDTEQERLRRIEQDKLRGIARKKEEAERLREAAKLEKAGKMEEADAVIDKPFVADTIVVPVREKVEGVSYPVNWGYYEILDIDALPRGFMIPDHEKLRKYGIAMKADGDVSGVRFFSKKTQNIK